MKDVTKKVVILDNLASPFVSQAIIVMRDYNPKLDSKAVTEAERIVSAYLDNMKLKKGQCAHRTVRKRRLRYAAAIILLAAAAAMCVLLIRQ